MREMLIQLIMEAVGGCARHWAEVIADHLLYNGVTVPPCRVGETVYALYSRYRYTTRYGTQRRRNSQITSTRMLDHYRYREDVEIREKTCSKQDIKMLGKTVFSTKADAENAVKDLMRFDNDERRD